MLAWLAQKRKFYFEFNFRIPEKSGVTIFYHVNLCQECLGWCSVLRTSPWGSVRERVMDSNSSLTLSSVSLACLIPRYR